MLIFGQDFEVEAGAWSVFCRWCLVDVLKLNLGRDSETKKQYFEFQVSARCWCLVEMVESKDSKIWLRFVFELVIWLNQVTFLSWTQLSGRFAFGNVSFFCLMDQSPKKAKKIGNTESTDEKLHKSSISKFAATKHETSI